MPAPEMTTEERRAVLVWRLANGERLTTCECAAILGVTQRYCVRFLNAVSRVTGIYYDDPMDSDGPRWQRIGNGKHNEEVSPDPI